MDLAIAFLVCCLVAVVIMQYRMYMKYRLAYKNMIKQSFSMTIAMGEYHAWIEDHLKAYLVQQVLNNPGFLEFAKKSGISITTLETELENAMRISADYIKFQSKECLRKVAAPLDKDINDVLEKQ